MRDRQDSGAKQLLSSLNDLVPVELSVYLGSRLTFFFDMVLEATGKKISFLIGPNA